LTAAAVALHAKPGSTARLIQIVAAVSAVTDFAP
jgi:hypothetical protein